MTNPIKYVLENFGKRPEPKPPIIPGPWRIPFFIGVAVLSFAVLFLLVTYVVIPGIEAQQAASPSPVTVPVK